MTKRLSLLLSKAIVLILTINSCMAQETSQPGANSFAPLFSYIGDYPLGTTTDRIDYQSVDAAARRIYIAKMGAEQLLSFDLEQERLAATLDNFPKVTGVLVVPELHKVYASVPGAGLIPSLHVALGIVGLSAGRGAVAVLDAGNLHEITRLPGGVFPDGIAYDPKDRKVFVSDEFGTAVLVINADKDQMIARIDIGGEAGNVRYDPQTSKVYVAVQSKNALAMIDPATNTFVKRYELVGADHPHGLIIAPGKAIGYVACDGNDRLLTIDLTTGKVLARNAIARDPDVLAVDPGARRLYVAGEGGDLSSLDITDPASPRSMGDTFIGKGAHSVAVDSATHRLYLPLADVNGQAVLRILVAKPE